MEQNNKNSEKPLNLLEGLHYSQLAKLEKPKLIQLIQQYERENKELKAAITLLEIKSERKAKFLQTDNSTSDNSLMPNYNPEWQGLKKILYILKAVGRIMQSQDIKSRISRLEPERTAAWGKRMSAVEKYIHKASRTKSIVKLHVTGEGYFYGLPEWFENGELINSFAKKY